MPRAKFLQMIVYDIVAVCLASAMALLMVFSSIRAREHTQPPHSTSVYNSSASAVCGVWLFFQIYVVHSFRAKFPQFQLPVIIYSIFVNVSTTFAPRFVSMTVGLTFVRRMLEAFLTGLGIATATSLLILPVTSRSIVFKQMAGYVGGLRATLKAHSAYFESLEHEDMFGRTQTYDDTIEKMNQKGKKAYSPEAEAIMSAVARVNELHGKLRGDITFAKREFAIGHLGPDDIQTISKHLGQIRIPVVGLSFVMDVFQRLSEYNRWNEPIDPGDISDELRHRVVRQWNDLMSAVHAPFQMMMQMIDEGLQHATYVLKMEKPPKTPAANNASPDAGTDVESQNITAPGEKGFAVYFEKKLAEFGEAKRIALRTWSEERGIHLPPEFFEHPSSLDIDIDDDPLKQPEVRARSRRQLYMFLYVRDLDCKKRRHDLLTDACTDGTTSLFDRTRCSGLC